MVDRRCAMTNDVRPRSRFFTALPISISVRVSTEEVASSRISTAGLQQRTRAIVSSCRCPTEIFSASLSSGVSYPPGRVRMKKSARAAFAAATISSRVASGLP